MNLEQTVDQIFLLKQKRDRVVALYDEQIRELETQLEAEAQARHLDRVEGRFGLFFKKVVPKVKVQDWAAVQQWVLQHKALDLLQKRLAPTAVREHLAAGDAIPGVELTNEVTYQIRKRKEEENSEAARIIR